MAASRDADELETKVLIRDPFKLAEDSDKMKPRHAPEDIKSHKVLWGECLGGALYWKDLAIIAQKIGFCPPRLVTADIITVENKELEGVLGDCRFVSATFRLFKLPKTEPAERCRVVYNGGIKGHEKELIFDARGKTARSTASAEPTGLKRVAKGQSQRLLSLLFASAQIM